MIGRITFWLNLLSMVSVGYIHGQHINEFHYDNTGADEGEFIEVVIPNPQPVNPSEYKIFIYNGGDSMVHDNRGLQGITAECEPNLCYYVWSKESLLQNQTEAIAFVRVTVTDTTVFDFISYEGTIKALDGPVEGLTSTDVGILEDSDTPVGWSLQRRSDGTWFAGPETKGSVNPIVLLLFEGKFMEEERAVWLNWKTASELNNKCFEVQRSNDQRTFHTLVEIPGAGNSATIQTYDFMDGAISPGVYYYRVKQNDFDGRYSFTSLIRVEVKETLKNVHIRPFLVQNSLQFIGSLKEPFYLSLYSSQGKLLWHHPTVQRQAIYQLNIPMQSPVFYVIHSGQEQWSGYLSVKN